MQKHSPLVSATIKTQNNRQIAFDSYLNVIAFQTLYLITGKFQIYKRVFQPTKCVYRKENIFLSRQGNMFNQICIVLKLSLYFSSLLQMLSSLFNENKNKATNIISLTVLFFITDRNELIVLPLNWHYSESSNCVRSLPTPTRQLAMGDQKCPHTRTVKHSLQTKKCYDYEIILRISSSFSNKKYFT